MVLVDEVIEDRRLNLVVLGWLAFVLWEGYWIWEIAQRYFETNRLELPYMFLFFILVVIPLAVYLFIRRRIRGQRARQWPFRGSTNSSQEIPASRMRWTIVIAVRHRWNSSFCCVLKSSSPSPAGLRVINGTN